MDLRQRKTERALRAAFLELRGEAPTSRITVRALCERAEVAPATFYLHYHDIYELSQTMQSELIAQVVEGLPDPHLIVTDGDRFMRDLWHALRDRRKEIAVLFSGERESALPHAVEERIRELIERMAPGILDDVRLSTAVTLQLQGSYWAWRRHGDQEGCEDATARCAQLISSSFSPSRSQQP